jgi:uncharacterized membrane protein YphA (DoxX/SURF4 family)
MFGSIVAPRGMSRVLLSVSFLVGGVGAWRRSMRGEPGPTVQRLGSMTGLEPSLIVKVQAGAQIVGAGLFGLSILPRVGAVVLAVSLVPSTIDGPNTDGRATVAERTHAIGLLGGLILAALDTGARPSVFWSARRKAAASASRELVRE